MLSIKDSFSERQLFTARCVLLFGFAALLVLMLIARMLQLQVLEFETYQTRSDENRVQVQPLAPPRGLIYDRQGVLLADNRPQLSLSVVRERVPDFPRCLKSCASW